MADRGARNVLLTLASLVVVVAGLKAGAPLLVPLMTAVFLTLLVLPLLGWLERRMPRVLAATLTMLATLAFLTALGFTGRARAFLAMDSDLLNFRSLMGWASGRQGCMGARQGVSQPLSAAREFPWVCATGSMTA